MAQSFSRNRTLVAVAAAMLLVAGCGGTKVYDLDKTVVLHGNMYNVTDTKSFTSRVEGTLPSGEVVNLARAEKDDIERYTDQGPMRVTTAFVLDGQDIIYESVDVEKWSEFRKLRNDFEDARDDLQEFMADKKDTQLELN